MTAARGDDIGASRTEASEAGFVRLEALPRLSERLKIDLRVLRDDLYPVTGGGSKARKIGRIVQQAEAQGYNALVTMGGLQSNHARVTALAAAAKGWRCTLVLHGNADALKHPSGNLLLMLLAGSQVAVVEPSAIADAMCSAMKLLATAGYCPYEIPGGGHSVAGAMAFVDAVAHLGERYPQARWQPEWVIHASGTGTTQAGLIVGFERIGWPAHVVGISVARPKLRGRTVVEDACRNLRSHLGRLPKSSDVDFRDDWVGEGYEHAGHDVLEAIRLAARHEGLILDPTYTGKAFAALLDMVGTGEIEPGARVLFWHTGGLMNLMASEYFTKAPVA